MNKVMAMARIVLYCHQHITSLWGFAKRTLERAPIDRARAEPRTGSKREHANGDCDSWPGKPAQ